MLEMACLTVALTIVLGGLALIGISRNPVTEAGAWYATSMIVTGLLVSFATCLSTYFQARLYSAGLFAFSDGHAAGRLIGGERSPGKTQRFKRQCRSVKNPRSEDGRQTPFGSAHHASNTPLSPTRRTPTRRYRSSSVSRIQIDIAELKSIQLRNDRKWRPYSDRCLLL